MAAVLRPGGPKKIVVKTLKKNDAAAAAEDPLERSWPALKDFLAAVHGSTYTQHSFQELYSAVESLVLAKQGAKLYDRLYATCESHIASLVSSFVGLPHDAGIFLSAVQKTWSAHCGEMIMVRNVFLYLDRTFVRDTPGTRSLWDMGLHLFRERLVSYHNDLLQKTVFSLVTCISSERKGEAVDRGVLSSVCRMLGALGLYSSHLEPELLSDAEAFYASEGHRCIGELDAPSYLIHCEARLKQEKDRVAAYLDQSVTLKPMLGMVEKHLLSRHATALLEKGFVSLMDGNREEDLRRLYSLLSRVNRVEELKHHFSEYSKRAALAIVTEESEEKDKEMVQALLDFRDRLEKIVYSAFAHHHHHHHHHHHQELFSSVLKAALETAINSRDNRPAELIARYVDLKMKGGARAAGLTSDEELEALLDKVMALFKVIHGKDVFEAFYKKDLAKRLLLGKSASTELERSMVGKLKTECGSQFTAKLEGMFKDNDLSKDLMTQFQASKEANGGKLPVEGASSSALLPFDLFVSVLTASYWPGYTAAPAIIPPELMKGLDAYGNFYSHKFSNARKLAWQHQLGHCIVKATFPSGKKELEVSTFQALVLLLFNDGTAESLQFPAIKEATGIEDAELRRTLQSLALGKARVLKKEPKGKDVLDTDTFSFNADFKDPLYRIKINTIQAKETKQEVEATHERIMQDRQYQIDAAIVRIMKTRKSLSHTQLLGELFTQLRFKATPGDCKKRIESLIERDYLERDDADSNVYNYLA